MVMKAMLIVCWSLARSAMLETDPMPAATVRMLAVHNSPALICKRIARLMKHERSEVWLTGFTVRWGSLKNSTAWNAK